jgi:hypothetical protein
MPYEKHPRLTQPADDAVLWRYMPLDKFLSLVHTKCLFFTRADKMRALDGFEGRPTIKDAAHLALLNALPEFSESSKHHWRAYGLHTKKDADARKELHRFLARANARMMQTVFINCWHSSAQENDALWKVYTNHADGVCIKTTM